ncbi:tetratricopeptide repeat protein [Flavobacterium litorale]|uniref:Tetratricopeptide repeat protein n=1 Tax=Flavobacterium litorale TaxID=2856519 RepID=A0ABX8V8P7_9FLAO|nr:tetratricopeptide repeat protein [Flavobacterium litorale]QYJ69224.1 tetratricopeptide repeat protein [Flavobacterium litorale]
MVKLLLPLLLLTTVSGFSQKQDYDFEVAERDARKIIYTSPSSALAIVKQTLAQKNIPHDTIWGNTYNLYGMYYGMTGKSDSCIYYVKKSLPYLEKYPKNRMRSLMNLCIGYRHKGEYNKSLYHLKEALELSKKLNDKVSLAKVYGEMASNYNYRLEYDKSVNYLLKGIEALKTEDSPSNLVAIKQKLANTYLAMENYEFAADLYKETIKGFKEAGMDKNYYLTYVNLSEAYIRLKRYSEAKEAIQKAIPGLEKFGDMGLIGIAYSKLAMIEYKEGNNEKSIQAYQKAFDKLIESKSTRILRIGGEYINVLNEEKQYSKALKVIARAEPYRETVYANIQDRMVYVEAIADTYSQTGNTQKAFTEYRNTIAIKDSISDITTEAAVKEIQAKFQTELQREKNIALETKNEALERDFENNRTIMLLYFFVSIGAIIMILAFLRSYWLKTKLQKEQLKSVETENELIKQQHKYEQEFTNAQKEIINEKQRELTAATLQMANYQDSIKTILDKCKTENITTSELKKELQQLLKQKDYWKQFETRFNSLHPEFEKTLSDKFPKLTKNDVEFCSLLKLNLTNKEIASLLQISHESTITKKYRIKKKMEIKDDTEFEKLLLEI